MRPRSIRSLTNRSLLLLAFAASLATHFACRPAPPPPPPQPACGDGRWVALKDPATSLCPDPTVAGGSAGWQVRQLFDPAAGGGLPPALADFCLYEDTGSGNGGDIPALVSQGHLASASRDCPAVFPAATMAEASCASFHDELLDRVGRDQVDFAAQPAVRLALLDTIPTLGLGPEFENLPAPQDFVAHSLHGTALARLAGELVCDQQDDCAAAVVSRLAMSCTALEGGECSDTDTAQGGYAGTVGELAVAIFDEVQAWQKENAQTGQDLRLILQLALGWDQGMFPDLEVPAAAVHVEIERAVCQGALVVAAAGNPIGGPPADLTVGPLHPAAWETQPAPDPARCRELLAPEAPAPPPAAATAYTPLVHAVGSLRFDGRPLALSRPASQPRLAAYGDHWCPEATAAATLTGTSVSTTAVASIAAAVWQAQPELAAADVMAAVFQSAETLAQPADFYLEDHPSEVRRASLCRAVHKCQGDLCTCPSLPAGFLDLSSAGGVSFANAKVLDAGTLSKPAEVAACSSQEIWHAEQAPQYACPFEQQPGVATKPLTWPQPGEDPCPSCGLGPDDSGGGLVATGTYTLFVEIPADFAGVLSSPTLTVGSESYCLALDVAPGQRAVVTGLELGDLEQIDRLDLTFAVTKDGEPTLSAISHLPVMSQVPASWQQP
jgi:Subtilase family